MGRKRSMGFIAMAIGIAAANSTLSNHHMTSMSMMFRPNPTGEINKLKGMDRHGMPKRKKKGRR